LPFYQNVDYPHLKDSDNDGMPKFWEDEYGLDDENPADGDSPSIPADSYDFENDGTPEVVMTNRLEYFLGTDPTKKNTDGDTFGFPVQEEATDAMEVYLGNDPIEAEDHP
jgi:hypothetical protein